MFIIRLENASNKIQRRIKVNRIKILHVSSHTQRSLNFMNIIKQIHNLNLSSQ